MAHQLKISQESLRHLKTGLHRHRLLTVYVLQLARKKLMSRCLELPELVGLVSRH